MPGCTIHIAIAKRYIEKHELEIKNEEEFLKGAIVPDFNQDMTQITTNKSETHYGKWGNYEVTTNIDEFLKDTKIDMEQDYWKGYFVHLLTDHYFYNKYFKAETSEITKNKDRFYDDYDCLNRGLIEKYKIEIWDNIKKYMGFFDKEPKYLKQDKVIDFIEEISDMNIQEKVEIIKQRGMEGLK